MAETPKIADAVILWFVRYSGFYVWALAIVSHQAYGTPTALPILIYGGPVAILAALGLILSPFLEQDESSATSTLADRVLSAIFPTLGAILITPFSVGAWAASKATGQQEGPLIMISGSLSYLGALALALL